MNDQPSADFIGAVADGTHGLAKAFFGSVKALHPTAISSST